MPRKNTKLEKAKDIKIESGVPLPRKASYTGWPFNKMKAGDSFEVPAHKSYNQASCAVYGFQKKYGGKFSVRKYKDKVGCRVWCLEPCDDMKGA